MERTVVRFLTKMDRSPSFLNSLPPMCIYQIPGNLNSPNSQLIFGVFAMFMINMSLEKCSCPRLNNVFFVFDSFALRLPVSPTSRIFLQILVCASFTVVQTFKLSSISNPSKLVIWSVIGIYLSLIIKWLLLKYGWFRWIWLGSRFRLWNLGIFRRELKIGRSEGVQTSEGRLSIWTLHLIMWFIFSNTSCDPVSSSFWARELHHIRVPLAFTNKLVQGFCLEHIAIEDAVVPLVITHCHSIWSSARLIWTKLNRFQKIKSKWVTFQVPIGILRWEHLW